MKVINISGNQDTGKTTLLQTLRKKVKLSCNDSKEKLTNHESDFVGIYHCSAKDGDYWIAIISEGDSAWAILKNLEILGEIFREEESVSPADIRYLFYTSHNPQKETQNKIDSKIEELAGTDTDRYFYATTKIHENDSSEVVNEQKERQLKLILTDIGLRIN